MKLYLTSGRLIFSSSNLIPTDELTLNQVHYLNIQSKRESKGLSNKLNSSLSFRNNTTRTQTPTQKLKICFLMFSSQENGSDWYYEMI